MRSTFIVALLIVPIMTAGCEDYAELLKEGTKLIQSQSIFLQPTDNKTVYLKIHSASDNPGLTLSELQEAIAAKGYTLVEDPERAHFVIQSRVVSSDATSTSQATLLVALLAGTIFSAISFLFTGDIRLALSIALPGALAGAAFMFLTEAITYTATVDVQIRKRLNETVQLQTHQAQFVASTTKMWRFR